VSSAGYRQFVIASALLACGCSAETNVLGMLTPNSQKESFENMLAVGRAAYDRGDFELALEFSTRAIVLNRFSEDAALLYGYTNLALSGIDPFTLARKMISAQETKKAEGEASLLDEAPQQKDTTDVLSSLQEIIGLSENEFALLGTLDKTDPELPVLVPKCAEEARAAVATLRRAEQAIFSICPFVDEEVKVRTDVRQLCYQVEGVPRTQTAKAHFLWAFAHLSEALAFNSVLTYTTKFAQPAKTNLEQRVEKIRATQITDPTQISGFVDSVNAVEKTVSAILPVGTTCSEQFPTSQLKAMLNDMLAVDKGFARLPGIPTKITGAITKAMARIQALQDNATSNASNRQASTLKSQFTKRMSQTIASKITELETTQPDQITEEKRTELCSSYRSIAGADVNPASVPALCQTSEP